MRPQTMKMFCLLTIKMKNSKPGYLLSCYRKDIAAFDIDSKVKDGRLALMYRGNTTKPQLWF